MSHEKPTFEDNENAGLTLSQEYLKDLRDNFAELLMRKGRILDNPGVFPAGYESTPRIFRYPLNPKVVQQIFFSQDDVIINNGEVNYYTPTA